jgi:hypothetical protein
MFPIWEVFFDPPASDAAEQVPRLRHPVAGRPPPWNPTREKLKLWQCSHEKPLNLQDYLGISTISRRISDPVVAGALAARTGLL